ncbi:MAG: hypothetical protein BroJett033_4360 [Chloroflexota bacterium]|nr:MAG: hypothetical protein BroJett033_4360 [Chloroflexota bacterium]
MKLSRQSRSARHAQRRSTLTVTLLLVILLLALPGSAALRAQESPTPTATAAAGATDTPTDPPPAITSTVTLTSPPPSATDAPPEATAEPTAPATDAPPEATAEPTAPATDAPPEATAEPTATATDAPPEATAEPTAPATDAGAPQQSPQTSCRLEISDQGDSNPYTFRFTAISAGPPTTTFTYGWNMGNGTTFGDLAVVDYTYPTAGSFIITLTCTPSTGAPFVLTGTVLVTSNPIAAFDLLPGSVVIGLPPFTISTLNRSSGGSLSYQWVINTSSDPLAPGIYTATTENISYTFPGYGSYWFHLFATDLAGTTVIASQQLTLQEPPPLARFDMTPTDGLSPLTVTFAGVDQGGGPITSWEWDLGDGSPPQTFATNAPFTYTYTIDPLAYPSGRTFIVRLRYTGPGGFGEFAREVGVYPASEPVDARFSWQIQGNAGGGLVTVCFTNLSAGPWVNSYWDWEDDGVYDLQTTDSIVCRDFPEGPRVVRLWVADSMAATPAAPSGATSDAAENVSVVAAPVASFTAAPGTTITWGDLISFTDTSTGTITSWSWDFDGDGVEDSSERNPANIALGQTVGALGGNTIRLTVTGPGGSSYAEMLIVVARRAITCAISGPALVVPNVGVQTYTGAVSDLQGRAVSYTWRVTGTDSVPPNTLPLEVTGGPAAAVSSLPLDFAAFGPGTFVITLDAQTADGASCSATQTVTHNWRPLVCQMLTNPALPSPHYPSTTSYNFTVDTANLNLDGRAISSIRWAVNGTAQPAADDQPTFARQWLSPTTETIRYDIEVNNGDGTTSSCYEEVPVTVQSWPALTCDNLTGTFSPQPITPDNPTRTYTYTAAVGGAAGRTVTYTWTVAGGTITSTNPRVNNPNATVQWNAAAGSFPPAPTDESIAYTAQVTNPDGTTDSCNRSQAIGVTVNRLVCNTPTGDVNPVVGETENYSPALVNGYGRPVTLAWEFQTYNTVTSTWENVTPAPNLTANPFSYQFLIPDAQYRLRYNAAVAAAGGIPADSCGPSPWLSLAVDNTDVVFDCDSFTSPAPVLSASANYPFTISMDNGNGLPLNYTWVLVGPGTTERALGTYTGLTGNGTLAFPPPPSTGFPGAAFGPVDDYTVRVDVSSSASGVTYTCSMARPLTVGTLNVSYSFLDSGGGAVNASAVEVGREICFTNGSSTSHGGIDAMTYNWNFGTTNNSLGVATQAGQNPSPACFSFTQPSGPGGYTVTLTGEALDLNGVPNGRTASYNITFYVYGTQSIAIDRSSEQFAPTTMSFTPIGVNITNGYSWLFEQWDGAAWVNFPNNTKTGPGTVNQFFGTPGRYRATVSGSGPLGVTTAQAEFELLALTSIRAAFTPAPYGGMAPLNVCFTDRSASSAPITSWAWDFDNDGTVDSTAQNPCTTYTAGGTSYTVTLNITNANGQTATATNVVRTYRDWESSASFSITPQGAGRYCFTANITGVTLLGWNFGDGTTGGPTSPICTTYGASGTYVVSMEIRNPTTGETGTIQRGLDVVLGGGPAPSLSVTATCSADRTATFRVTNSGGAMTVADIVTVRDVNGSVIRTESLLLAAGSFRDIILTDMDGPVTLTTLDSALSVSTGCSYRPVISVAPACGAGSLPVFTVSNARPTDGPMAAPQPFTITNSGGSTVLSGSFELTLGETSEAFSVPAGSNPYDTYTFNSSGAVGTFAVSQGCAAQPTFTVTSQCVAGDPVFTVTNTSANPMVVAQAFTITGSAVGDVTPAPGTFQLAAGAAASFTLIGLDPYDDYTFTTSGFAGSATETRSCGAPALTVTSACASPLVFTVTNSGANMLLPQTFTITDGSGADVTPAPGTFNLTAGGTASFTLTGLDPYAGYTFASSGFAGTLNLTQDCARPALAAVSSCTDPLVFTVTNSGGDMLAAQPYTVRAAGGAPLASGALNLAGGASQTITLTGISPYGGRTLETAGFAGAFSQTQTCAAPRLVVRGDCATSPASFTVINNGGDMLLDQPFTLIQNGGADITPPPGMFSLNRGDSLLISVPPTADMDAGVVFATARFEATAALTLICPSSSPLTPTPTAPGGPAVADNAPRADGLGAGVFALSLPALTGSGDTFSGPTCGVSCPVWRVYHSDDTGDWEIYRLDGALDGQTQRTNLSHGPGASDMSPSRSPDARWIAFTSNRDSVAGQPENWEIYIASASGDPASVRRVTHNTFALDTNPAWGPNNAVVYQTTRHGNWELYLVDMETGREYRLTDSAWNEINPVWSPDGSRVAFQSDRDGRWHIYVLDLAARSITQLTDDTPAAPRYDVDPQFAPDGSRIAFRRYEQPGGRSTLMLMDADGQRARAITAPDMDATNQAWSPSGRLIAFQAVRAGQLDVYVYDTASGQTRQLTDSAIPDYAPTWLCGDDIVVFTSDVSGSPDIYEAPALPVDAPAVDVAAEAERLTFEPANDIYPQNMPPKEFASREGQTSDGVFGLQTEFLLPAANVTPPDLSQDSARADDWSSINTCPAPGA